MTEIEKIGVIPFVEFNSSYSQYFREVRDSVPGGGPWDCLETTRQLRDDAEKFRRAAARVYVDILRSAGVERAKTLRMEDAETELREWFETFPTHYPEETWSALIACRDAFLCATEIHRHAGDVHEEVAGRGL